MATLIQKIRRRFRRRAKEATPLTLRRWDAAKTDRLNKAHWQKVTGTTINADLAGALSTLRTRACYEAANNPDVEGVINTHVIDVIGAAGPQLQIQSENATYNEKLERVWRQWWKRPDINGRLSGVELLDLWLRNCWTKGEFLAQIVTDSKTAGPIQTRIHSLAPERLVTPVGAIGKQNVVMGVELDALGKPLNYWIDQTDEGAFAGVAVTPDKPIPAAQIIHRFRVVEDGQVRGVPWLAGGLQATADLRDYDAQVMDAARQAADMSVLLYTRHPDAQYVAVNESVEIERRTQSTLPPGWEPYSVNPTQPSTRYVEFVEEQLRRIGRPVNMPLMMVKLDSRKHNYSSARFDGQIYHRGNKKLQGWLATDTLDLLVDLIAREAELAGVVPKRPESVTYSWNWPAPASVDETKDAKASRDRLDAGTSTLRDECARSGAHWEDIIEQRQRERQRLEEAGLYDTSTATGKAMEDLARAVRAGVPITVGEARTALGPPEEPDTEKGTLRFNDQDILAYHIESGVLTINEARGRLNLPAVGWGDVPVRRANLAAVTPDDAREADHDTDAGDSHAATETEGDETETETETDTDEE